MPYYEYECSKGHIEEVEQRIVADPLKTCPKKGCRCKTKRLISRTNFQLKGNGWFNNGYAGPSNAAPTTKADREKAKAARVKEKTAKKAAK